jgi:ribosome-binding protein aMBF1 (putative translation factor)
MKTKKGNTKTWAQFKDEQFGKRGSPKREKLEAGYETFKLGAMIQEARHEQGMTQEELAEKCGTTKSYISKLENDVKEVRISTLQKIVHEGLDGELQLNIKLRQRLK